MVKVGVHVSIAGGLDKGLERANDLGCDTAQMFLSNPRSWSVNPLKDDVCTRFLKLRHSYGKELTPIVAHTPYLLNLAAQSDDIYQKSIAGLRKQLERCDALQIEFLVLHMGKHKNEAGGVQRMVDGIKRSYAGDSFNVALLLENMAGQGSEMGAKLSDIASVYHQLPESMNKGLCLDTCHAFAAGYEFADPIGFKNLLKDIKQHIGMKEVKVIHLNDSRKPLGSRVDRHATIGDGHIGLEGFRQFLSQRTLRNLPLILELPTKSDDEDREQMKLVRSLVS